MDVCPVVPDPLQADSDADGDGDLCECGDADSDGVTALRDWVFLVGCEASRACSPLCDVTDDGLCDADDPPPLRRYLAADFAKHDLRCAQRPLPSDIPEQADEEEPPVHFLDPPTPGYVPDDPLAYGTDDLTQDPGPGPRRPAIGGTLANSGDHFVFLEATAPATSSVDVVHPLGPAIVERREGRWADVFLGRSWSASWRPARRPRSPADRFPTWSSRRWVSRSRTSSSRRRSPSRPTPSRAAPSSASPTWR